MKSGTLKTRQNMKGERIVIIEKKIVVDNGKYISPRVKAVYAFANEERLYDYLADIEVDKNERRN